MCCSNCTNSSLITISRTFTASLLARRVCKTTRELTTSAATTTMRSALFRTAAADPAVVADLVDSSSAHQVRDPDTSELIFTRLSLHPLLRSPRLIVKPKTGKNRKVYVRAGSSDLSIDEHPVMDENATQPCISQAEVRLWHSSAYAMVGGPPETVGRPASELSAPLTVKQVVKVLLACERDLREEFPHILRLLYTIRGSSAVHLSDHGDFELAFRYKDPDLIPL